MGTMAPQTATLANVPGSASSVVIFAAFPEVNGRCVYNDSTAVLYLKFGTTASATSYTVQVAAGGFFEFPCAPSVYAGEVDGIWASAAGNARTTQW